ncbi:hypothetical protein [Lignipirellula cremea]|uniref:HEAT repeat protein n=1 Tax=Lignipirellula cremea TaxID=2528010 RepID=A0A518DS79_9BACT|nr:hypothetical protein [Lignipirellula cremea]QDU94689.1 HEAT repeat protein [Lignipirellula cremea]
MKFWAAVILCLGCGAVTPAAPVAAQEVLEEQTPRTPLGPEKLRHLVAALVHQDANIREAAQGQLLLHAEQAMPLLMGELADSPDERRAAAAAIVLANMRKVKREMAPQTVDHRPIVKTLAAMLWETTRPLEPWRWYLAATLAVMISDEPEIADSRGLEVMQQALYRGLRSPEPMKRYAAIQAAYRFRDPRAMESLWAILRGPHRQPQGVDLTMLTGFQFALGYTNALGVYAPLQPEFDPDKKELQIRGGFQYFDWDAFGPPTVYVRDGGNINPPDVNDDGKARQGRAVFVWEEFLVIATLDRLDADPLALQAAAYRLADSHNLWIRRDSARVLLAMLAEKRPIDQRRLSLLLIGLLQADDYETRMFAIRQLRELQQDQVDGQAVGTSMVHWMQDDDFDVRHEAAVTLLQVGPRSQALGEAVLELIEFQKLAQQGLVRRLGGRIGGTAVRMLTATERLQRDWVRVYGPATEPAPPGDGRADIDPREPEASERIPAPQPQQP